MQTVFAFIYLIIYFFLIDITWYAIGIEKTRNSAIKMNNKIMQISFFILKSESKEYEKYEGKTRDIIKKYNKLAMTSKLLTLMGVLIVGNICYSSILNLKYEWYINFLFILLIIYSIGTAINSYANGCKIEEDLLKPMIVEWEHEENVFLFKKIGRILILFSEIMALIYLIALLVI